MIGVLYITTKKTVEMMSVKYLPKPRFFHIQWHVTDRCNWHCKHCYQTEEYLKNELDLDGLLGIFDKYLEFLKTLGIRGDIAVSGGEPFIRKDFFQLLEKFYEHGIRFEILTNGSYITRDVARRLKELDVDGVQVSMEGMKATNDEIRGKGSFEKIIKAARNLVEEDVVTAISFTVHRKNYKEFPQVVELGRKIGVHRIWSDRLVPWGHGKQLQESMLEPFELKEYFETVWSVSRKLRREGSKTHVPAQRGMYWFASGREDTSFICPMAERALIIMPNGDALSCRRAPILVGNLTRQRFFEIWYGNDWLWRMRNRNEINSLCRQCEHFERCMGGSRCVTYAYCGDPFAPDPQCWKLFDKLPSPEELRKSAKDAGDKEVFLPRLTRNYPISGSECECPELPKEGYVVEARIDNLEEIFDEITENGGKRVIFLSLRFSENELNMVSGEKLSGFLQKLKKSNIDFRIMRPVPRCLFGSRHLEMVREFNIPQSCRDCPELFKINNEGMIESCTKKQGPKLKYMNYRNQIHEYFELFEESRHLRVDACRNCVWFLRGGCNGLCSNSFVR